MDLTSTYYQFCTSEWNNDRLLMELFFLLCLPCQYPLKTAIKSKRKHIKTKPTLLRSKQCCMKPDCKSSYTKTLHQLPLTLNWNCMMRFMYLYQPRFLFPIINVYKLLSNLNQTVFSETIYNKFFSELQSWHILPVRFKCNTQQRWRWQRQ